MLQPINGFGHSRLAFQPSVPAVSAETCPAKLARLLVVSRSFEIWSEVWIRRQILEFKRLDVRLLCWESAAEQEMVADMPVQSVEIDFNSPSRWWRRLRLAPTGNLTGADGLERQRLEAAVRDAAPDVILCHFGTTALRILPVAEAMRIPIVAHFHGYDLSTLLRYRYYAISLRSCARRFAHCVVVGSHQQRILRGFGVPNGRISLIPCGAPTTQFQPKRSYAGIGCRFVAVSRLVPWKGLDVTLRAFAATRAQLPQAELHIVGTGPEEPALRALVSELQLERCVTFHGIQPPERIHELMLASDVFLQHSLDYENGWQEGFGVSIAEASSSGLPVIVTDAGGIADQVADNENGLITPQRDVAAMAARMIRLGTDQDLRRRLGTAGRYRAARDLDSGMLARRLERLILSTAARAPSRRTTSATTLRSIITALRAQSATRA